MENFDIAVIGGGPGGYVAAIKAAQHGKRVCLLEQGELGGICLNQGCIPTKTLLKSVEVLNTVRKSSEYGVIGLEVAGASINMTKLQQRKYGVVKRLTGGVGALLKANGVKVFKGSASFLDRKTLKVNEEQISADNIIIATGSVPSKLPIPVNGGQNCPCHAPCTTRDTCTPIITSEEALEISEVPNKVVIIGGGVIGIEFAYIFANLGSEVTVVEMMDRILPMVDEEITSEVSKMLKGLGIEIFTEAKVTGICGSKVTFEHAGAVKEVDSSKILVAVGRVPNTEGLNLEILGIEMNRRAIKVDEGLRTNVPGIYAIGDVNGTSMLAHTASMEGIIAVENILGKDLTMDYSKIPSCIYIQPEIASVGLTEKQAREKYGEIKIGKFPLSANGKAVVEGEAKGLMKVIIEPEFNEILGVHMYGIHATDMISESVLAMSLESTAEEMTFAVHPHPTVAEIIPEAFHSALGKAIHSL
jgi:dihydrolipoamide dehydrogenase